MKREIKVLVDEILKDMKENKVFSTPYYMLDLWILVIRHIDSNVAKELEDYINSEVEKNI